MQKAKEGHSNMSRPTSDHTGSTHLHDEHAHSPDLLQHHIERHIRLAHVIVNDGDLNLLLHLTRPKLEIALREYASARECECAISLTSVSPSST